MAILLFISVTIIFLLLIIIASLFRENTRQKFILAVLNGPTSRLRKLGRIARLPMIALAGLTALALMITPGSPAFANPSSPAPHVFGSSALPIAHTQLDGKWQAVRQGRIPANDASLNALIAKNRAVSRQQQVAAVNSWVNGHIVYRADEANYGQPDRWTAAAQTLNSGRGDCEDYAIAKYQILRELGIGEQDLFLVIGRDRAMRADHAVLAVRVGSDYRILDNFTDRVLDDSEVRDFLPTFSFSSSHTWLHGMPAARPASTPQPSL